jgi:HEAT repeat protein
MKRRGYKQMEPAPLSMDDVVAELINSEQPLQHVTLSELSDLSPEELSRLEQVWASIDVQRRRQIVSRMVEMSENNAILNFDAAFKMYLKDDDAEVRSKAIEGLWESEDPSLIEPFIQYLELNDSEQVQSAAAVALGKFALLAELGKLRSQYADRVVSALITGLEDSSLPVKVWCRVLEAAAPLNLPQVKKAINDAYYRDDYESKISAIYAMGRNCDPSWLSLLLRELESNDNELRYEAAGACGELGEEEAVPYLVPLVNDPDLEVRLAAIQALGKIGGAEAKDLLNQYLDTSEEAAREAVEQALDEIEFGEDPLSFRYP